MDPGTLYVVATPIGNLEDLSFRAVRVLKEVDLVAAEDTRRTLALLRRYGVHTPLTSYHEHNEKEKARELLALLQQGKNIALVSDAGTPGISDPGFRLVEAAARAGVPVSPVPGPVAFAAALSASGLPSDRFAFEGFLPAKKSARRRRLEELRDEQRTLIFYEAPHRLGEALRDLLEIFGDRRAVVAREFTKIHEEFVRGRLAELAGRFAAAETRGEVTLIVEGAGTKAPPADAELAAEIARLKGEGMRAKEIAEALARKYACSKKEIYRLAVTAGG
ncbi:MAG TPA: 16S rRNA (cytidine(1402)-2'-O)-methyltransferase [candidate division Zixibacteria bacterium]|nr:16S rRNA (cytidine(1402)-2'-O)-methyltransferase [candidate division Zixibacteria bacterium]